MAYENLDLTTKELDGTGIFDELMEAVALRLSKEFDKKSITASEYAKVYLGSMQSVLQQSVAFLLGKDKAFYEAETQKQQLELIKVQVANAQKEGLVLDQQVEDLRQSGLLKAAQVDKINQEVINLGSQKLVLDQEVLLTTARTNLTNQEVSKLTVDTTNAGKEGLILDSRKLLVDNQVAEVAQRTLNMVAEEAKIQSEKILIDHQAANAQTQNTTLVRQQEKLLAEKALLTQKLETEKAQTTTGTYTGVVGAQIKLYEKQRDGFDRDAEQKATKILVDTWNVRRSTDTGTSANTTNKLDDASVGQVITKLIQGIQA